MLALAGIASSAPQPPGSTFKIVTLAGVLREQGRQAQRRPSRSRTRRRSRASRSRTPTASPAAARCEISFAHSCNSVFAPLGAKLGAEKLVETAEKFGFNEEPPIAGAARSTIPAAAEIGDDLAVGSSAIGQGKVLATPLQMALVAATIGADGVRPHPTLLKGDDPQRVRATSKSVARTIKSYMRTVVTDGTGGAAALAGIKVSGKTGTAELRTTVKEEPPPEVTDPNQPPPEDDTTDTDAWFVAFAPYRKPTIAVAVMLVGQGAGGDTAAPAAGVVLKAAPHLEIEVDFAGLVAALLDLELERAVLQRVGLEPEEDQRALDRAAGRGGVRASAGPARAGAGSGRRRTGWTPRRAGRAGTRSPRCR